MKIPLIAVFAALVLAIPLQVPASPGGWIPGPAECRRGEGTFALGAGSAIRARDSLAAGVANHLGAQLKARTDLALHVAPDVDAGGTGGILLELAPPAAGATAEGYTLEVTDGGVLVRAATRAGLFYGAESLLQLAESAPRNAAGEIMLAFMVVTDQPRFAWRGVMLDESRHFFGKKTVEELLDTMARLKLNRFHWHLTDETGWRIEITKYPKLTTIGATGNWSDPKAAPAYYTQDDIREIVEYAGQRHIVIVPEIDMPGHATAACRAYPELSGGGTGPWRDFTFNPAREQTYRFIGDVLAEIAGLFPGPYLHIGGDEVHFGNQSWSSDPGILEFSRAHQLKDAVELERYFIRRVTKIVRSLGKTALGWDEVADAGLSPADTTVMWWRHDRPQVLGRLLEQGYPVVLSPRVPCYLDFVQHESHTQGRRWKGEFSDLERLYAFPDTGPMNAFHGKESNIIGIEGCLWTERIQNADRLWFMALPRLLALAESAWTPAAAKSRPAFDARLREYLERLERAGRPHFDPFLPARYPEPPGPTKRATGTANG